MKIIITSFITFTLLCTLGCVKPNSKLIELKFENDLFPEGIAINSKTQRIYLNSLKNNKIVTSNLNGNHSQDFLTSNQYGYQSGFGMTIKNDTLYALGNGLTKNNNESILLLLELSTGSLIESYTLKDTTFRYLNDLTISSKNEIFITDSESQKIYIIQRPSKEIKIFLDSEHAPNCNGISISNNAKYLYLASRNGICIIDTKTKKLVNTPNQEYAGIDGLKYYEGDLYGIVNGWRDTEKLGLFKFELNENGSEVLRNNKLVEFTDEFKVPTTFDIHDESIYFVVNTQLDNFDENSNSARNVEELEPYKLLKKKIK